MTFIDGSVFEGSWKTGKFHGIGNLTFGASSMLLLADKEGDVLGGGADDSKEQEEFSKIFKAQLESEKFIESQK